MAVVLKELARNYRIIIDDLSDPRTKNWFLLQSPAYVLMVVAVYYWFVKIGGPAFMKNRKPYNIDRIVQAYNLIQVFACGYVSLRAYYLTYSPWGRYKFSCEPIDFTDDEFNRETLYAGYSYFFMKIVDLLDTVFFVLRKKDSQVTFLHIYHHIFMVILCWSGMKWMPNGHSAFIGIINSFVHSVMYFYYFVTNWNSEYKKNIWWKKYITQLQMFQFLAIFLHFTRPLFTTDCKFPKGAIMVFIPQNLFIFVLFADFYRRTYMKKPTKTN